MKVEIVEMKVFYDARAANFFRFYIIKIAKVGLRIKVEIVGTKVFHGEILFSDQPFFQTVNN